MKTKISHGCENEESLSRFLDNDLPSREAAHTARHLQTCSSCQSAYQQMQQAQTVLRGFSTPDAPFGGPDAARVRVFERVRRSVRVGDAAAAAPVSHRRTSRFGFWAGSAAAMCLAGMGMFSWNWSSTPISDTTPPVAGTVVWVPEPVATPRVPLPSRNEMAFLYHLHDAHSASLSVSDPTDRRDCAAEARAALLHDSERLADTGAF